MTGVAVETHARSVVQFDMTLEELCRTIEEQTVLRGGYDLFEHPPREIAVPVAAISRAWESAGLA